MRDVSAPLEDVRIIDLTRVLAGPYATTLLADLGADVIKVEDVELGDSSRYTPPMIRGVSDLFLNLNRNKRSVAIDLKHPGGREVFLDLVRRSDVVVENFRPGVMERLGIDYPRLSAVHPGIIVCSVSGFGQSGRFRDRPSFDIIIQALSGAMAVTGEPERPPVRLGVPLGDLSGGLFGALGILAALHERSRTGRGQLVDVSMLDGLVHLMLYYPVDYLNAGKRYGPVGGRHENIAPYGVFAVKDGYLVLAIFQGKFWRRFCEVIGRSDLSTDPRFTRAADRLQHKDELYPLLEEIMLTRTRDEWEHVLTEAEIPHAPILTPDQVPAHPAVVDREMFVSVEHPAAGSVKVSGRPIKFPARRPPAMQPAPGLGQHTRAVLRDVAGYSEDRIGALERDGIIRRHA